LSFIRGSQDVSPKLDIISLSLSSHCIISYYYWLMAAKARTRATATTSAAPRANRRLKDHCF
ncbi:MAG: hypothetical protein ACJ70U_09480, partial [Nitrososphaera sp.]